MLSGPFRNARKRHEKADRICVYAHLIIIFLSPVNKKIGRADPEKKTLYIDNKEAIG